MLNLFSQTVMLAQPSTVAMAWSSVARCRSVFLGAEVSVRHFAEVSIRHFGTSAHISGQFGTSADRHFGTTEMSWVRSVLGQKCRDTLTLPMACADKFCGIYAE